MARAGSSGRMLAALLAAVIVLVVTSVASQQPATASHGGLHVTDLTDARLDAEHLAMAVAAEADEAGVTIDRASVSFTGDERAAGELSDADEVTGFADGIVLGTGEIVDLAGANEDPDTFTKLGTDGDGALSELVGAETFDAAVLEFEFEVAEDADEVFFTYVFGSEEYNEWVGSEYNDVFAFWVNGENCAVVPDPDAPVGTAEVSIQTVNAGWDGSAIAEANEPEEANSEPAAPANEDRYVNNDPVYPDHRGETVDAADLRETEMDGFTVPLTCAAEVTPGATNTMRLAIADTADEEYDSWVLIESGSLTTEEPESPTPEAPAFDEPGITRATGRGTGRPRDIAIEICRYLVPERGGAEHLVLAREDDFADALAGSALPDAGCMLFTPGGPETPLHVDVGDEIDRALRARGDVTILGGEQAISAEVESALEGAGYATRRLAGPTRYETAEAVAGALVAEVGTRPEAILASGQDWPDAVTAGAYAARRGAPVLLTPSEIPEGVAWSLHPATERAIEQAAPMRTHVVGGAAVVPEAAAQQAPNPARVAGPNRMGTAVAVAEQLWGEETTFAEEAFVLANLEHPDGWVLALAAARLSAELTAPQLGVRLDDYPVETREYLEGRDLTELPAVPALGDTAFISEPVLEAIRASIEPEGSGA